MTLHNRLSIQYCSSLRIYSDTTVGALARWYISYSEWRAGIKTKWECVRSVYKEAGLYRGDIETLSPRGQAPPRNAELRQLFGPVYGTVYRSGDCRLLNCWNHLNCSFMTLVMLSH